MAAELPTKSKLPEVDISDGTDEKCKLDLDGAKTDEYMTYILDIKVEEKREGKKSLKIYLIILFTLCLINIFWLSWISWRENYDVSTYKLVHVNIIETKDMSCDSNFLANVFSCLITNPYQANLPNLPECYNEELRAYRRENRELTWDDVLGIVNKLKYNDKTKFVDAAVRLGTQTLGLVGSRVVAGERADINLRLVQMSVCLGDVTGYVTLIDGVIEKINKTLSRFVEEEETEKENSGALNTADDSSERKNKGKEVYEMDWIPCIVTPNDISCRGAKEHVKISGVNVDSIESRDQQTESVDAKELNRIISKISTKADEFKQANERTGVNTLDHEVVDVFFELFELPVVKNKFNQISSLLTETHNTDKNKVDLSSKFIYCKNFTSYDNYGLIPPGFDWIKWFDKKQTISKLISGQFKEGGLRY